MPEENPVSLHTPTNIDDSATSRRPAHSFFDSLRVSLGIIGLFVVGVSLFIAYLYITEDLSYPFGNKVIPFKDAGELTTIPAEIRFHPAENERKQSVLQLKKYDSKNSNPEVIISWTNWDDGAIFKWQDELIYVSQDYDSVFTHNIKTAQTKKVFSNDDLVLKYGLINSINVYEDNLFVSVDGYTGSSDLNNLYVIKLPDGKPKGYKQHSGFINFDTFGNQLVLVAGWGDGCGSQVAYWPYDSLTESSPTKLVDVGSGCVTGDHLLGYYKNSEGLLVSNFYFREDQFFETDGVYTNLTMVSLQKPNKRTVLISEKDMPKFVTNAFYDSNLNAVILVSPKDGVIYSFNLVTKELKKLFEFESDLEGKYEYFVSHPEWNNNNLKGDNDDMVCISYIDRTEGVTHESHKVKNLKFVLSQRKAIGEVDKCRVKEYSPETYYNEMLVLFKNELENKLNLPSNYKLEIVEIPDSVNP